MGLKIKLWPAEFLDFITSSHASKNVVRFKSCYLTHAMAISRRAMASSSSSMPAIGILVHRYRIGIGIGIVVEHYDIFLVHVLKPRDAVYVVVPLQIDQAWCMGTDNSTNTALERTLRKHQCAMEKINGMTIISYTRDHPFTLILIIVITITCLMFMVWALASSCKKGLLYVFSTRKKVFQYHAS